MYGLYANIGGILMVNVTIYSIHGSWGPFWDRNQPPATPRFAWSGLVDAAKAAWSLLARLQRVHCGETLQLWVKTFESLDLLYIIIYNIFLYNDSHIITYIPHSKKREYDHHYSRILSYSIFLGVATTTTNPLPCFSVPCPMQFWGVPRGSTPILLGSRAHSRFNFY